MLVIPAWTWHRHHPVGMDVADSVKGAVAIINRSSSRMLVSVTMSDDSVVTLPIAADSAISGCSRWRTVNIAGTTNGGSSGQAYEVIHTTGNGAAFTNQPANDGIEVVSSNAADTTQTVTIYGTTNGTDTVVVETVTLNGTTQVSTVKVDWGVVLGVTMNATALGTVTVREASGNATITTMTAGQASKGVETVTSTSAYNVKPTVAASGATTKQIGLYGTAPGGTVQGDSQALTGATAVAVNSTFNTVTLVLTGDLESDRTVTVSVANDLLALF